MVQSSWRDGFFIAADGSRPAEEWLIRLPSKPAAEIIAVIMAVRDAPPPSFAGGGKWEAMHGDMAGIFEVRSRQGDRLHRLFCLLDRKHPAGPTLVMLDGDSKLNRTAMRRSVYRRIRERRDEYRAHRRVDLSGG